MPVGRNAPTGRSCASAGEAAITSRAWTSCRLVRLPRSNCLTRVSIEWFIAFSFPVLLSRPGLDVYLLSGGFYTNRTPTRTQDSIGGDFWLDTSQREE